MSDTQQRLAAALTDRYRIEREIGAGGMATVYLAHDLKHERDVAIKVLHPDLGAALGAERFLAEIKTTAKLQHPHILGLIDSGAADGLLFYVMPFVAGESLRARLERARPLPIAEALRIAREVASALDYAHRQGVVHRDIKPENILLHDGQALVADFGIALAVQSAGGQRMTQTGLSLGTPQYMSPEQAMGERGIDARSDIYALGAVTYEMLAGEPPFSGASVQAIVARVLNERPTPLHTLRDTVSAEVEAAVATALAKLPADRFESAKAFADALGAPTRIVPGAAPAEAPRARLAVGALAAVAGTALVLGLAGGRWMLGTGASSGTAEREAPTQMTLPMRPGERLPFIVGVPFVISPDGRYVLYEVRSASAEARLLLRDLSALDPIEVPELRSSQILGFSPDGASLFYRKNRSVYRRQLADGTETAMPEASSVDGRDLTWLVGDHLAWFDDSLRAIVARPVAGGEAKTVSTATQQEPRALLALPRAGEALYLAGEPNATHPQVWWVDVVAGESHQVDVNDAAAALGLMDQHFVYVTSQGDVMAAPWDSRTANVAGPAVQLLSGVSLGGRSVYAKMSASGDLLYLDQSRRSQLLLVSSNGSARAMLPDTFDVRFPRISPDGRSVAFSVFEGRPLRHNLYLADVAEGRRRRLDVDDEIPWRDRVEWGPDGNWLYYRTVAGSRFGMARRPVDRSGGEERFEMPGAAINEVFVLRDGRTILGRLQTSGDGGGQLVGTWTLGDTTVRIVLPPGETSAGARVSPDGRWLAYVENRSGVSHAIVTSFPDPGTELQVDVGGAGAPVWGPDSRTLYYPDANGINVAVLDLSGTPRVASRRVVYPQLVPPTTVHADFDVAADGSLLVVQPLRDERLVLVRDLNARLRTAVNGTQP